MKCFLTFVMVLLTLTDRLNKENIYIDNIIITEIFSNFEENMGIWIEIVS